MGTIHTRLALSNPIDKDSRPIEVEAHVDAGAALLCVPEQVALQLGLERSDSRKVPLADGSHQLVDYAGPIEVTFENRKCFVGAPVMGDEVLLGAVPMEDMELQIQPLYQTVTVNPGIPSAIVKRV